MFPSFKLRAKILIPVLSIVFITLLITTSFVTVKAREISLSDAHDKAEEMTYRYSEKIKSVAETAMDSSKILASSFEGLKKSKNINRETANEIFKNVLLDNSALFTGIWSRWETNMLDGKDEDFIGQTGNDNKGRYSPYWEKENNSAILKTLTEQEYPEENRYYGTVKKDNRELLTPPRWKKLGDKKVLITSLIAPINIDQKFSGVIGIDINLNSCSEIIKDIAPFGTGYTALISNNGTYILAPNKSRIGKKFEHKKAIPSILSGSPFTMTSRSIKTGKEVYRVFAPIKIGNSNKPWSLEFVIPITAVLKKADQIMHSAVIIGIIALTVLTFIILLIVKRIVGPISDISELLIRISKHDLTADPSKKWLEKYSKSKDEIGEMYRSLLLLRRKLSRLVFKIKKHMEVNDQNSRSLANLSEETSISVINISTAIEKVADLSESNSAALEESSAGVQEVASGANNTAQAATDAAKITSKAQEYTNETGEHIAEMIDQIKSAEETTKKSEDNVKELSRSVKEISSFVEIITNIADQTNLLALNAAIEAARAGDAGRGFAVVADEVRKLAEESNKAAQQVSTLILNLKENAGTSTQVTEESRNIMKNTTQKAEKTHKQLITMTNSNKEIEQMINDIASTAQEQARSSEEIACSIEQATGQTIDVVEMVNDIRNSSTETKKASEEVAIKAQEMQKNTKQVQKMLSAFKVEWNEKETGLSKI